MCHGVHGTHQPRFHKILKTSFHRLTGLHKDVVMFYETEARLQGCRMAGVDLYPHMLVKYGVKN